MRQLLTHFKIFILTTLGVAVMAGSVNAATYTAIASGNFSSSSTWSAGIKPPATLTIGDQIIIPNGINVMLDQNVMLNVAANMDIDGTLSGGSGYVLNVTKGTLTGSGSVNIDSIAVGTLAGLTFAGNYTVNSFYSTNAMLSSGANVTVNKTLYLAGGVMTMASGILNTANGVTIVVNGGSMNVTGGTANLTNSYHVMYKGSSVDAGLELTGNGLTDITVDMSGTNEVKLTNDLTLNGTLTLSNGQLALNSNKLTLGANADIAAAGSGTVKGDGSADLAIMTAASLTGELRFSANGNNTLRNLTINTTDSSAMVKLGTELNVSNELALTSGRLHLQGNKLNLSTGATVNGGSKKSFVVTTNGGVLSAEVMGGSSMMYHVGTETNYAPMNMTSTMGSVTTTLNVGVDADVKAQGDMGSTVAATQPVVDATWFVTSSSTTNVDFEMEVWWDANMEVNSFNRAKAYISHYTNAAWDVSAGTAATVDANGMYKISRSGIKSFSPFAVFDENTAASVNTITNNNSDVSVYPNPVADNLTVKYNSTDKAQIEVYNIAGQKMNTVSAQNGQAMVDVSKLKSGVYFVQIKTDNAIYTQEFVKQ